MYEKAYRNGCKEVVNDIALLYRVNTTSHLRTTPPNYSSYNKNNVAYINAHLNNQKHLFIIITKKLNDGL